MSQATTSELRTSPAPSARVSETPLPTSEKAHTETSPAALSCSARGVKKSFGDNAILKGVDVDIPEGCFAVLVGPSGCGKSTLLRLVAGLEQPDEGSLHIAGKDVTRAEPRDRDIAMVFQSYALYPHLTVKDNLSFGLKLRGPAPGRP